MIELESIQAPIQLDDNDLPYGPITIEQFITHTIFYEHLGYHEQREWQPRLTIDAWSKKIDIILVAPTASGKTSLIHAPSLADNACRIKAIAIVVIPTKALAHNHVSHISAFKGLKTHVCLSKLMDAVKKGLSATSINEDTLMAARLDKRNLYTDLHRWMIGH